MAFHPTGPVSQPPVCEKCAVPMQLVAAMPSMNFDGKTARVFKCMTCDRIKWVDR